LADFEKLMHAAFALAEKGLGYTSPNPPVGAIIIKNGQIISQGYHRKAGLPHAEIEALRMAGGSAKGATLISTLEPCSHHKKKTPPCADAIIAAGIKRVVGAVNDRNPQVNGRGYRRLRGAGIEVTNGVLKKQAERFYAPYFKFITTGIPFVTLKLAQSIDGRIAASNGHSRWISSPQSLKLSHQLRAINDSILIGRKTLDHDDPELTTRLVKGTNPVRIVISGSGKFDMNRKLFTDNAAPTYLAVPEDSALVYDNSIRLSVDNHGLALSQLLKKLGDMGIISLLVEGGSGVLTSFLRRKLADKVMVCLAPIMIGKGIEAIGELGVENISNSIGFKEIEWIESGPDMVFSGRPVWR